MDKSFRILIKNGSKNDMREAKKREIEGGKEERDREKERERERERESEREREKELERGLRE